MNKNHQLTSEQFDELAQQLHGLVRTLAWIKAPGLLENQPPRPVLIQRLEFATVQLMRDLDLLHPSVAPNLTDAEKNKLP